MKRPKVLLLDSAINIVLGFLLLIFPERLVNLLGMPPAEPSFYPSILGAVLLGIGIGLLVEHYRRPEGMIGLGLGGAVAINLCGGIALTFWLLCGKLDLPPRGRLILWLLAVILVGISAAELITHRRSKSASVAK
jgi:hypothetical protein